MKKEYNWCGARIKKKLYVNDKFFSENILFCLKIKIYDLNGIITLNIS